MIKTFKVPFNTGLSVVEYTIKVTDRQEERDGWKRAEAINRASEKFAKDYGVRYPGRYLLLGKVIEV